MPLRSPRSGREHACVHVSLSSTTSRRATGGRRPSTRRSIRRAPRRDCRAEMRVHRGRRQRRGGRDRRGHRRVERAAHADEHESVADRGGRAPRSVALRGPLAPRAAAARRACAAVRRRGGCVRPAVRAREQHGVRASRANRSFESRDGGTRSGAGRTGRAVDGDRLAGEPRVDARRRCRAAIFARNDGLLEQRGIRRVADEAALDEDRRHVRPAADVEVGGVGAAVCAGPCARRLVCAPAWLETLPERVARAWHRSRCRAPNGSPTPLLWIEMKMSAPAGSRR